MKKYVFLFLTIGVALNMFAQMDASENHYFIVKEKTNKKYGVIDMNDNFIISYMYDRIESYRNYFIVVQNEKYGLYNPVGKLLIPPKYDHIQGLYYNGKMAFCVRQGKEDWLINENEKMLTTLKYEAIGDYIGKDRSTSNFCGANSIIKWNRAMVKHNDKWGWINIDGEEVIPCQYDDVFNYDFYMSKTGIVAVKNNANKWGVIDTDGQIILPFIYDHVYIDYNIFVSDAEEHIQVTLNDHKFEVDKNGKKIKDL